MRACAWFVIGLAAPLACGPGEDDMAAIQEPAIGSNSDPSPSIAFTQGARTLGTRRSNEPASAGTFNASGTLAYGGWLADLDGDGLLDYFGVNHGQLPHVSGLFINNGAGFGKNLYTVSFQPSQQSFPNLDLSN